MQQPRIVWQNEHAVACEKPSGWLSVPSRLGLSDSRPILGLWLQNYLNCQIYPLHRLDLEVSGLMLFAKTADAHRTISRAWESHSFQKVYAAWTTAIPLPLSIPTEWQDRIAKGKKRAFTAPHGKEAITTVLSVEPLAQVNQLLWHLAPITGRSHQLRFALSSRGAAIIGDKLYGSAESWTDPQGIGLRAISLSYREASLNKWLNWPEQRLKIDLDYER